MSDDSCSGWLVPPGQLPPDMGTDNAPNIVVGGDFSAPAGAAAAAEGEGLLVVAGNATFDKGYAVAAVGAGSGVLPADGADMLIVGGDATVNGADTVVTVLSTDGPTERAGAIHVGGSWSFRDPSWVPNAPYGTLGSIDSQNQISPAATQNVIDDDVSVLATDHYTDLFGAEGKMSRYSQQCYAELSSTDATTVENEDGTLLLEHGTVTTAGDGFTLESDGSGELVVFDLPATFDGEATISIQGVTDTATVLINTLSTGQVTQLFGDVTWGQDGADGALAASPRILWNYPFATSIDLGGQTQFPGAILVGTPDSALTLGFSGTNGRVYTPGNLSHTGSVFGFDGLEIHAYPFTGALGCVYAQATGGFSAQKAFSAGSEGVVDDDAVFTLAWEVTAPEDSANLGRTGTLELPASGAIVAGPTDLAVGDVVTFTESGFPSGAVWVQTGVQIDPNPLTISADGNTLVTVTNTALGGFEIVKSVTGTPGAQTTTFTGDWSCDIENTSGQSTGTWTLNAGQTVTVDGFPLGTECTVTENPAPDPAGTWESTIEPATFTIGATITTVTITNTFQANGVIPGLL